MSDWPHAPQILITFSAKEHSWAAIIQLIQVIYTKFWRIPRYPAGRSGSLHALPAVQRAPPRTTCSGSTSRSLKAFLTSISFRKSQAQYVTVTCQYLSCPSRLTELRLSCCLVSSFFDPVDPLQEVHSTSCAATCGRATMNPPSVTTSYACSLAWRQLSCHPGPNG